MTPREHKDFVEEQVRIWHIPLRSRKQWTLKEGLDSMSSFKLQESDVPLIIKLVENPKYDIGLFAGNVSLYNHDCIHLLRGRGLEVKDEAFVIGYTMGSTKKMLRWRKSLFAFCSKNLYPEGYKFREEERFVFNMGVMAGSCCEKDLSSVDFNEMENSKLKDLREELQINKELLVHCYEVEKRLFPESHESQRLL